MNERRFTEIVFIDGPDGSGKDFFIENFIKKYTELHPEKRLAMLKSSDYTYYLLKKDRDINKFETGRSVLDNFYKGHIELIDDAKSLLSTGMCDLIIVNRSFASFQVYNLRYDKLSSNDEDVKEHARMRTRYIDMYRKHFHKNFKNVRTTFISMEISGETLEEKVNLLINRLKSRDHNTTGNDENITYLIHAYENIDHRLNDMYDRTLKVNSSDFEKTISDFFMEEST